MRRHLEKPSVLRWIRRAVLIVVGFSILLFGLVLVLTPIPGMPLVALVGLGILAGQFVWARKALRWVKQKLELLHPHAKPQGPGP